MSRWGPPPAGARYHQNIFRDPNLYGKIKKCAHGHQTLGLDRTHRRLGPRAPARPSAGSPGGRRTGRAGVSCYGRRACSRGRVVSQGVTGGHRRVHPLGLARAPRISTAHRASQGTRGTPGTWPTHGVTQGQMSEAVLRYPHQRRKFLSRLYVLTSSSEPDNWSSYHNATYP